MNRLSIFAWALTLALVGAAATSVRGAPYSFDSTPGRLPKDVVPQLYRIAIVADPATLSTRGTESITLRFRKATDRLVFNSWNETFSGVRLDGRPVVSTTTDEALQLTTVRLASAVPAGIHTLSFTFAGKIETRPRGLFLQRYSYPDGAHGELLTTQMEPADARRMFPCWDEPAFRAQFRLTFTMPRDWRAVANMPVARRVTHGDRATVTFRTSPKMASYLVELTAGDLAEISGPSAPTKLAVWAVRGEQRYGRTALANAERILADYDAYFGIPFPLPKLDSIAIPGGWSGAMENWGAITYTDQLLLVRPSSSIADRQMVYSTQAHEMAHQWFGDLVTMAWWDDVWLNESFASWMSAKETALRNPSWHWWETQDAAKENAMAADALTTSQPIHRRVTDDLQAMTSLAPAIAYAKGQTILRMFEAYLGPETFRAGLRLYLRTRAYSNATATDLWDALERASGKNVGEIARNWIRQPGFPLVKVEAACDAQGAREITLTQGRFLLHGEDRAHERWIVPMQLRIGAHGERRPLLLARDGERVRAGRCGEPLSADAGAIGYYRVEYDPATLAVDTADFAGLPAGDRIALLDDQWALVQAGAEPLPTYLALASRMGGDLDTRAWQQIASSLGKIEYDERGAPGHAAFARYARSILAPVFARLGWTAGAGETPDRQKLRRTLLADLGAWGDSKVVTEARRRFTAFLKDRSAIPVDDQEAVLSVVMEHASPAEFNRLRALARHTKNGPQAQRLYLALTHVRDPVLAKRVAEIALSTEIPPQDSQLRLLMIAELARDHAALAWSSFTANRERLLTSFGNMAPLVIAQYVPQIFWNGVPLERLESWARAQVPAEMGPALARGVAAARQQLAEKRALTRAADAFVAARG